MPMCDVSLSFAERVTSLVSNLTLAEKMGYVASMRPVPVYQSSLVKYNGCGRERCVSSCFTTAAAVTAHASVLLSV